MLVSAGEVADEVAELASLVAATGAEVGTTAAEEATAADEASTGAEDAATAEVAATGADVADDATTADEASTAEVASTGAEVAEEATTAEVASTAETTGAEDASTGAADEAGTAEEATTALLPVLDPVSAAGMLALSSRVQPVLAVSAAGQVTCLKLTFGLLPKKSKRQLQPDCRAVGKVEHVLLLNPPYWAPQPEEGAPHSSVQALKRPTPPPGTAMSNWFEPRSLPVLVACTIIFLPDAVPVVKVSS